MLTIRHIWIALAGAALALSAFSGQAAETSYGAKLTGASELPEPTQSKAEGELTLLVSPDGKKISYTLTVRNIRNAEEGDIHLGPDTANGPLVVKLFPVKGAGPKKGEFSGVLAEGTITAADLIGPLLGSQLSDLIEQIAAGNAYTNIHTNDHSGAPNTGPGDLQRGEIRGQIK